MMRGGCDEWFPAASELSRPWATDVLLREGRGVLQEQRGYSSCL